eukprot:gene12737-biopygen2232
MCPIGIIKHLMSGRQGRSGTQGRSDSFPSEVGVPTPPPQRRPHKGCSRCEDRGRAANAAWHVPRPGGTRRPPPLERARRPGSRGAVHGCLSSRAQSDGRSPTQPGGGGRPGARGGSRGAPKSAAGGAGNGEAGGAGAQRAARRVLSYQVVPSRPGRVHTPGSRRGVAGASPALSAFEASPGCPLGHANLTYVTLRGMFLFGTMFSLARARNPRGLWNRPGPETTNRIRVPMNPDLGTSLGPGIVIESDDDCDLDEDQDAVGGPESP